ncbi:MAG TPA: hypothetical protein VHR97_09525 [Candidatus Baltobacteraceae bacterium]|jgi:hypothetical protein|nr:hypothetical protein [Candidatus Baltobacteraceae bacterium]
MSLMISIYAGATVVMAAILAWRYKREPQRRRLLLFMAALWLAVPIVVIMVPPQWLPASAPGHPSWLSVGALVLLVTALTLEFWKRPSIRRRYAFIFGPIIVFTIFTQILYPLFWEH